MSTVLSTAMVVGLQKYSAGFRNLGLPLKVATFIMPVIAGLTIGAEEAMLGYERDQYQRYDAMGSAQQEASRQNKKVTENCKLSLSRVMDCVKGVD